MALWCEYSKSFENEVRVNKISRRSINSFSKQSHYHLSDYDTTIFSYTQSTKKGTQWCNLCEEKTRRGIGKKNKERKNVQCSIAGLMIERRGTDSSRIMSCTLGSVKLNLTRKGSRLCTRWKNNHTHANAFRNYYCILSA